MCVPKKSCLFVHKTVLVLTRTTSMICKYCDNSDVTVDDLQGVEGSISCSNSSLCKYCLEVANLKNAIDRLKLERYELKRNINRSHSPFFRLIPPEIIARISGFAITDFTIIDSSSPSPILLSSVCSDWRRIVDGTPEFWSSIKIDMPFVPQTDEEGSSQLLRLSTLTDEWLARSGQLPLNISLCSDQEQSYVLDEQEYCPIFKVLNRYSSRWHILNISIPRILLALLQPDCLPMLEQLHITSLYNPYKSITFPPTPRLNTFKIQSIRSDKTHFSSEYRMRADIGISWNTVTHLSVESSISSRYLFVLLRLNPQLVHCRFHNIVDVTEDHLESPIISPLKYLSLHHKYNPSRILDNLKLPSLETFVYLNTTIYPVIAFFKRSACSLHTLSLPFWDLRKCDRLIPLLQFLSPSLTRLTISRHPSHSRINFLSLLARVYTSQSDVVGNDFLPHLEIFEYRELEESASTLESSMLSNLLSRKYPKPATTISLRSAYITMANVFNKDIPRDLSCILKRLEEEGILTYI